MDISELYFKSAHEMNFAEEYNTHILRNLRDSSFEELSNINPDTNDERFLIIIAMFAKIHTNTEISVKDFTKLLDWLLFYLPNVRFSSLGLSFASLSPLLLNFLKKDSLRDHIYLAIKLETLKIAEFNKILEIILNKLTYLIIKLIKNPDLEPKLLNSSLRYILRGLKAQLTIRREADLLTSFASEYLKKIPEEEYKKNDRSIQKKLILITQVLNGQRVLTEESPDPSEGPQRIEIYKRDIPDYYSMRIYKIISEGEYRAVKEYSNIKSNDAKDKIKNEIDIMTKLSDRARPDNCYVKVYDVQYLDDRISITMEYFQHDLKRIISYWKERNAEVSDDWYLKFFRKLIQRFKEMEEYKIHHRDIKPQNIMMTENFEPKIIDFNVSKEDDNAEYTEVTKQEDVQGTVQYMAPELIELRNNGCHAGKINVGKADVFSLGLTFFELISRSSLQGLNTESGNSILMERIQGLNCCDKIKFLLENMLKYDRRERRPFNQLLSFLQDDEDTVVPNY